MPVFWFEVSVVEHEKMKRPAGAPDQLWGGPWFTPEVVVVQVEAKDYHEGSLMAAQMADCITPFKDPYVVDVVGPI